MKSVMKRLIGMIPVFIGVMLLIFVLLRVVPGDPVQVLLGEHYSQDTIDRLTKAMNLDKPVFEQFLLYLSGVFHGDLGMSYVMKKPVTSLIMEALPQTVILALMASVFAWFVGIGSGIIAAIKQNKAPDHIFMGFSLAGISVPVFMSALFLQYVFSFKLKLLPLSSDGSLKSLILPAIALGWNSAGSVARLTRSNLVDALQADYIDTAKAKGLTNRAVIFGHALRNSMLPVITLMAIQLSSMMSGAVVTESIFAIPGVGRLATNAIQTRDMPLLQGTVLLTTVMVIFGSLLADILYSVIDPRIRRAA